MTGKISGRAHCSLCDITHGWTWNGKEDWQQFLKQTELLFSVMHRNEQSESLALYTKDHLPCIVMSHGESYEIVMNSTELDSFKGNIQQFLDCLSAKFKTLGLS